MAVREERGRRRKERRGGQGRPHLNRDRQTRRGQPFRDEGGALQKDSNCRGPEGYLAKPVWPGQEREGGEGAGE